MAESKMFRSLRHRNARLFFLGLTLSNIGTWIQFTAMSLLVYRFTGKGTDVGINLLCQFLPMLLLGAWAGAVADRVNKRKMALITQSGLALQALLLGVLELSGLVTLPIIYVLSLALGIIGALDNPARRGVVVELVDPNEIPNVLALNTAVMTGSRIFGPALAALLVGPLGAGWLFIINGLSFSAILVPMLMMDTADLKVSTPAARGGQPVRDALRFLRRSPKLFVLYIVFTIVGTFAFNYGVSLLKLADERFGDRNLFGWLLTVTSVGNVIGSLYTASRDRLSMRFFFSAALLLGCTGFALSWAPNIWVAFIVSIPMGAGGAAMIASLNGISQMESPPEMRGRLLALGAVAFLGTTPIGAPVTGWVADHVGAEWSLAYGSVITLLCTMVGIAAYRRSLARDVPTGQHHPGAAVLDHRQGGSVVVEH